MPEITGENDLGIITGMKATVEVDGVLFRGRVTGDPRYEGSELVFPCEMVEKFNSWTNEWEGTDLKEIRYPVLTDGYTGMVLEDEIDLLDGDAAPGHPAA
jgi:hypothetical protein